MQFLEHLAMEDQQPAGVKKPIIMPDIFQGDVEDDWEEYKENFESCAEINGWDEATKCKFMSVRLKGNAYKVFKELDSAVKGNWGDLCDILEKRFKTVTQSQHYKTKFLSTTKSSGESLLDLGNRIRSLARKAYPKLDAIMRDELARDQFVRSLDDIEMTLKIRHQMPATLDDAIRMAIDWQTVEQDVRKGNDSAPKTSESSEACCAGIQPPEVPLYTMMKEMLTMMKEDREDARRARVQNESTRSFRCYSCGSNQHLKRNCPQNKQLLCWNCNAPGHTKRNCPKFKQSESGNG